MELRKIEVCTETLGITQHALKALRDTLADRIDHNLVVCRVVADDGHAYGLFVLDYTVGVAVVVGDGFRQDGGGEGGAGHRAAQALLSIWGIEPIEWDNVCRYTEEVEEYRDIIVEMWDTYRDLSFTHHRSGNLGYIRNNKPRYIDWVHHEIRG